MQLSAARRTEIRRHYRLWRVALGLTQWEVAARSRLTRQAYWEIEQGYRQPRAGEWKRLARVFKLTAEQLKEKVAA